MKLGMVYLAKSEAAAVEPEEPEPPEEAVKVEMYPSTIESLRTSARTLKVTFADAPTAEDFAAVAVSTLTEASFWSWHDAADYPLMVVNWGYGDGTTDSETFLPSALSGWQQADLLALLDPAKDLVWVQPAGYAGTPNAIADIARFDSFELCTP